MCGLPFGVLGILLLWTPSSVMLPGWFPARLRSRLVTEDGPTRFPRGPPGPGREGAVCVRGSPGLQSWPLGWFLDDWGVLVVLTGALHFPLGPLPACRRLGQS